ncbi:MAG: copper chaperone PCu(A)C [Pseudomonadota bacterium]
MRLKNILLAVTVALSLVLLSACKPEAAPISIEKGWVRAAPPGAMASAGYFEIVNRSDATIEITRVTADQFARVEIHETSMVDGQMKMRPVAALRIEPGQGLSLAPGGKHLMLFEPAEMPEDSDVTITLYDGDRPIAELDVPIARSNPYE